MKYKFSKHALIQMENRGISKDLVLSVLQNPDQIIKINGIWI